MAANTPDSYSLVLGAGRSGLGATLLLTQRGEPCRVSALNPPATALASQFHKLGVEIIIGPQTNKLLENVHQLVVSPGIPLTIPLLREAKRRGLPILSEIELALLTYPHPWIGITGTNGKSTCTHWLYQIVAHQGVGVAEVGNIGLSPSEYLASFPTAQDYLMVELSSYQIESSPHIRPFGSLFISFSPDHLDRHQSLENYFKAKWRLIENTRHQGFCILSEPVWQMAQNLGCQLPESEIFVLVTDKPTNRRPSSQAPASTIVYVMIDGPQIRFSQKLPGFELSPTQFQYHHERQNLVMSLLAAQRLLGCSWDTLLDGLPHLSRLPYRFAKIGSWYGQVVVNDSKATNVEAALAALTSLSEPCYLLLGGQAKPESFKPLLNHSNLIQHALIFGASGQHIAHEIDSLPHTIYPNCAKALQALPELMHKEPKPVLFAPACASFDEFENFEARGLYFNKALQPYLDF